MSTKYKEANDIPLGVIVKRLHQLSTAVTVGPERVEKEFTMSIPAELDRDADLVLSIAADRLERIQQRVESLEEYMNEVVISM